MSWASRKVTIAQILYFQRILKHVGLEYKDEVINWIKENTKSKKSLTVSHFTTSKDSKTVALKWREQLDISIAKEIDQMCHGEMLLLGYKPIMGNTLDNSSHVIEQFHDNKL